MREDSYIRWGQKMP